MTITEALAAVALALEEANIHAVPALAASGTINPPCVLVTAADPMLTSRDTLGSLGVLHLQAHVMDGTRADPDALANLADFATDVWSTLAGYATAMSGPFWGQVGDRAYLTNTITLQIPLD